MNSTTHGAYLIKLTQLRMINCYLVSENDGFTLIDTGMPGSAPAILAMAKKHNAVIRRIALTHSHGDHVGSLDALRQALPEAEAAIGAREARLLAGDKSLDSNEPQVMLRGNYPAITTRPSRLLQPGDRIGSLEVIAAPGHTPGHVAFLDTRDRTLIVGDAFQTIGGIAIAGTLKWWFPMPALATWHKPTALESARFLRALNPTQLAVGHGPVLSDPLTQMDHAINVAARHQRIAQQHKA